MIVQRRRLSLLLLAGCFCLAQGASAEGLHHKVPLQCTSGCDVVPDSVQQKVDDAVLIDHLRVFGKSILSEDERSVDTAAIDALLFYAQQTRAILEAELVPLPEAHQRFLDEQLARDHVVISLRLVDEKGVTRAYLDERVVPLAIKQRFELQHRKLPGLVASGTTVRTGAHFLWTRL